MSRETKKCTVASHFQKVDGEGYVCQIEKNADVCRAKLGSKLFNLKRHIERHHPDIFKSIVEEEQAKKQAVAQKGSTSKQQTLSKYFQSENGNGNGLLFHMTQPISRSTIKAIACSKPNISEH